MTPVTSATDDVVSSFYKASDGLRDRNVQIHPPAGGVSYESADTAEFPCFRGSAVSVLR